MGNQIQLYCFFKGFTGSLEDHHCCQRLCAVSLLTSQGLPKTLECFAIESQCIDAWVHQAATIIHLRAAPECHAIRQALAFLKARRDKRKYAKVSCISKIRGCVEHRDKIGCESAQSCCWVGTRWAMARENARLGRKSRSDRLVSLRLVFVVLA